MLNVQNFIKTNGLMALKEPPYCIDIKEYPNGLVVLNYDQIESSKHDPIVKECRGLILDAWNDYAIVAMSFNRFFNYGECPRTKEFDIINSNLLDKIDGSLLTVYHHGSQWHVATRKMAYAEGINSFNRTFRQVFDQAFDIKYFDRIHSLTKLNYVFELVSPETRIVTPYTEYKVFLLTVLDRDTGKELSSETIETIACNMNVEIPKVYKMNSFNEVMLSIKELNALEEGYVCVWELEDGTKHRIKIKNPSYLAIAHMRENGVISEKRIIHLVMAGDEEEYLAYFHEDRAIFTPYVTIFNTLKTSIHELWKEVKDIEIQKDFALKVKDTPFSGVMFNLRKGIPLEETFNKMSDNATAVLFNKFK